MELARARGSLSHLPYLLSTSGEIALAQQQPEAAETFFAEGLTLAERIPIPERIAGLTANLGLVARARGQTDLARERFTQALAGADALGAKHLAVRIRIWLAPLLPAEQRQPTLQQAQDLARQGGFQSLLDEISQLQASLA
jgi:Tfp pilus assembly protein PilF